eukprot:scaffold2357_cov167-Amphora_coffeaeformis.AAC.9
MTPAPDSERMHGTMGRRNSAFSCASERGDVPRTKRWEPSSPKASFNSSRGAPSVCYGFFSHGRHRCCGAW